MTLANQNCYQGRFAQNAQIREVYLFNHSNCSHQSLEVVTEKWQSFVLRCVLYRFHQFYHLLSLAATYCHLLPLPVIRCHSLSLADIRCTTHCQFCHSLVSAVIRCTTLCHSLLPIATRCITSLSFYKRLIQSKKFGTTYSLKIDVHKFQKCKTYSFSKTFEAVHICQNCLAKMHAYKLLLNNLLKQIY